MDNLKRVLRNFCFDLKPLFTKQSVSVTLATIVLYAVEFRCYYKQSFLINSSFSPEL